MMDKLGEGMVKVLISELSNKITAMNEQQEKKFG